jgi:predicted  nucleic acid-binding Zn-ribbon protein
VAVADDLIPILTRFHREVVLPDMQRLTGELRTGMNERFSDLDGHFDAIYQRFDRAETEYHMLVAGLKRVEERLDGVEQQLGAVQQKLEKMALRAELEDLKARVDGPQGEIRKLEERLTA